MMLEEIPQACLLSFPISDAEIDRLQDLGENARPPMPMDCLAVCVGSDAVTDAQAEGSLFVPGRAIEP